MNDTPLPSDLSELLTINRTLAGLIEPLRMILAMERAPGIGERLEAFMAELSAIREQMERAADTMERTLNRREEEQERQQRLEHTILLMQRDIVTLKAWFSDQPPEAAPT